MTAIPINETNMPSIFLALNESFNKKEDNMAVIGTLSWKIKIANAALASPLTDKVARLMPVE